MNCKQLLPLFLFLSLVISCNSDEESPTEDDYEITLEETQSIINTLADDVLKGRDTGSEGYEIAARFVEGHLEDAGYRPLFETYRDSGEFNGIASFNVVAINDDYDPAQRTILIGAHLDHIGVNNNEEDSIRNGANDNASGVSAVLQTGKLLMNKTQNENIILALFTAEEMGLLGSKHLAAKLQEQNIIPDLVFNFDMVGCMLTDKPGKVYITGYNESDMAARMNAELGEEYVTFLETAEDNNAFRRSDNFPFYSTFNIPSHTIITYDFENYPDYHGVDDETDKIDFENTEIVIEKAAKAIDGILTNDIEISLN